MEGLCCAPERQVVIVHPLRDVLILCAVVERGLQDVAKTQRVSPAAYKLQVDPAHLCLSRKTTLFQHRLRTFKL